jgi:tetratricopeptide (TPR) repeat protein
VASAARAAAVVNGGVLDETAPVLRVAVMVVVLVVGAAGARAHDGLARAIARADEVVRARPGDARALVERAALLRRAGEVARALADLDVAAALAPELREVALERGLALAAVEPRRAEAELDRFLSDGPPSVAALSARAAIREGAGRLGEARADWDAAFRLRADPELALARGRVDEAMGDLARAADGYEEALRALGGAVVVRLALVRVETARGRWARARALVDEGMAQSPLKAEWLLARADVDDASGRRADAVRARREALREVDATLGRKRTPLRLLTRARALIGLGRRAEAVRELEACLAMAPGLDEARSLLQRARGVRGRR